MRCRFFGTRGFLRRFQRRGQDKGVVDFFGIEVLLNVGRQFDFVFRVVNIFGIGQLLYDACTVRQVIWIFGCAVPVIF